MSLLQTLLKSLQTNIQSLETALLAEGGSLPHLYEPNSYDQLDDVRRNPPKEAFSFIDKIRVDLRAMEATVTPTREVLLNQVFAACKSTALNTATSIGVTDAIVELGGTASLKDLAKKVNVNENKLGRLLRTLATDFIYKEVAPNVFANTRHSMALLKDTNAHYFLSLTTVLGGIASTGLYENMIDPKWKDSFAPEAAPFCSTVSKSGQTFFQHITQPENARWMECIQKGVVPWLNSITRAALLEDYPWGELGAARVVDVGCGPGDCAMDIMTKYPKLSWTFQELPDMIGLVKTQVPPTLAGKVESGDITFQVQDYFKPNVSRGDVWFLRGVIREYGDEEAISVLHQIATAMKETKGSRMILNEVLCPTPAIIEDHNTIVVPSEHIPEEQSAHLETANLLTWNTYHLFGGKERSFLETKALLERAGLAVTRFFKFRTFTTMIECVVKE